MDIKVMADQIAIIAMEADVVTTEVMIEATDMVKEDIKK
jgi:hypothetical protein